MKANVGNLDRMLRIAAGIILLALVFVLKTGDSLWWWGLIGIVPLATGLLKWCPMYTILGIKTCPMKN